MGWVFVAAISLYLHPSKYGMMCVHTSDEEGENDWKRKKKQLRESEKEEEKQSHKYLNEINLFKFQFRDLNAAHTQNLVHWNALLTATGPR